MQQLIIPGLLWFCAIGCGLLGGLYLAFSTFIMTSLGRIGQVAGISAMNAINVDIVRSLFMPFFLGTTLVSAVLAGLAIFRWGEPGALAMMVGDPSIADAASLWARYLKDWTFWNHVRTIACTGASALFIAAIAAK